MFWGSLIWHKFLPQRKIFVGESSYISDTFLYWVYLMKKYYHLGQIWNLYWFRSSVPSVLCSISLSHGCSVYTWPSGVCPVELLLCISLDKHLHMAANRQVHLKNGLAFTQYAETQSSITKCPHPNNTHTHTLTQDNSKTDNKNKTQKIQNNLWLLSHLATRQYVLQKLLRIRKTAAPDDF